MLTFINKQGEKAMVVKDNGETVILNESLKLSFEKDAITKEKKEQDQPHEE